MDWAVAVAAPGMEALPGYARSIPLSGSPRVQSISLHGRKPTLPVDDRPQPPTTTNFQLPKAAAEPLAWAICMVITIATMIFGASVARRMPSNTGTETIWLVPSMCAVPDEVYNRFVSYIDPNAYADDDETGEVPTLGAACPAGEVEATPQQFSLPATLTWAPTGHNESLVVFRGEGDSVTLSFELLDARGRILLAESDVSLGPPPTPRGTSAPPPSSSISGGGSAGAVGGGDDGPGPSTSVRRRDEAAAASEMVDAPTFRGDTADDEEEDADVADVAVPPTARRLLKGGGGSRAFSHRYGGSTYASRATIRHSHTSVRYVPHAGVRTRFGYTARGAVAAGTFVALMHHPAGYGRYYDTPGCDEPARGCELRVEESLARDAFGTNFTMRDELAFPLSLRLTRLEVTRAYDGLPSVFLTLYSPTGGVPANSVSDQLLGLLWLPLVILLFCSCKLLAACTADETPHMQ